MPASASLGLDEGDAMSTMTGTAFRCHRTPVMEGFVTQSMDGKPLVNRLMGDIKGMGLRHACAPPCSPISGSTPIATTPPPRGIDADRSRRDACARLLAGR